MVLMDSGQPKNIAIEGSSPVQVSDIYSGFENSVELRHTHSPVFLMIEIRTTEADKNDV
jgi:hypothetical protein